MSRARSLWNSIVIYRAADWLIMLISLSIGLVFITGMGGTVQSYLNSFLMESTPNVYNSANGSKLALYHGVSWWLRGEFYWPSILIAIVVALFSLRKRMGYAVFFSALFAYFLAQTADDLVATLLRGTITIDLSLENAAYNFAGGLLIGAITVLILKLSKSIYQHNRHVALWTRLFAYSSPAMVGLALSMLTYYVCRSLYSVTPMPVDVYLEPPVNGVILPSKHRKNQISNTFSMLSASASYKDVVWTSIGGWSAIDWSQRPSSGLYNASVAMYEGCVNANISKLTVVNNPILLHNIRSLRIKTSPGISTYHISNPGANEQLSYQTNNAIDFSLAPSIHHEIELSELTQSNDGILSIASNGGALKISEGASLFTGSAAPHVIRPREIMLMVDGRTYTFRFAKSGLLNLHSEISCHRVHVVLPQNGLANIQLQQPYALVVLDISPSRTQGARDLGSVQELLIKTTGLGMLQALTDEKNIGSLYGSVGNFGGLGFSGIVKYMSLGSHVQKVMPGQMMVLWHSKLAGEFTPNGDLRFFGVAGFIQKDGVRMNRTLAERIPHYVLIAICGGFIALLGFLRIQLQHAWNENVSLKMDIRE